MITAVFVDNFRRPFRNFLVPIGPRHLSFSPIVLPYRTSGFVRVLQLLTFDSLAVFKKNEKGSKKVAKREEKGSNSVTATVGRPTPDLLFPSLSLHETGTCESGVIYRKIAANLVLSADKNKKTC